MKTHRVMILMLLFCLACAPEEKSRSEFILTAALNFNTVNTLNPFEVTTPTEMEIAKLIFGPGLTLKGGGDSLLKGMAESWTSSNDDRVWTALIRTDLVFHDGFPLGVEDVVFTYNRAMEWEDRLTSISHTIPINTKVAALDERRVRFTLEKPEKDFNIKRGNLPILPSHLVRDLDFEQFLDWGVIEDPIGAGPYGVVLWSKNKRLELCLYEDLGPNNRNIKKIEYKFLWPDAKGHDVVPLLMSGELDMARLKPNLKEPFNNQDKIRLYQTSRDNWMLVMAMNHGWAGFSDPKVRRALYYALDRQKMLENYKWNDTILVEIAHSPVPEDSTAFLKETPRRKYDPKHAKRLLAEAGWVDGDQDGILEKDGELFVFEVLYPKSSQEREHVVRAMMMNLWEVGIKVIPKPLLIREVHQQCVQKTYKAALFYEMFWPIMEPLYNYPQSGDSKDPKDRHNKYGYENPELLDLIRTVRKGREDVMETPQSLIPFYHRIQRIVARDTPCLLLLNIGGPVTAVHKRFQNILDEEHKPNPVSSWTVGQ